MKTAELSNLNNAAQARTFFANKMAFTTGPVELNREIERGSEIAIIDVREPEDYHAGHIPGAINLPRDKWNTRQGLNKEKTNVLYCYSVVCHLAAAAAVEFAGQGYSVMELDRGYEAWKKNELPTEK